MAHAAALYTVRVKKRYGADQPLGDIDGSGTRLQDVLVHYLNGFQSLSPDGERVVYSGSSNVSGDDLEILMLNGQRGVVADIIDEQGANQHHQVSTDTQLMRCGGIFRLPPTQTTGWLALHVNNGRGIKGLLEVGLSVRFRDDYPDLMLMIRPFVPASALEDALEEGKLTKVRLIRYEKPHDRAVAATDRWVRSGEFGKVEVVLSARGRGETLKAGLVKRFLGSSAGDDGARGDIVEFAGVEFEQVKVEVELDGRIRTFNIENPESGHPMTVDLEDLDEDQDGDPTEDSLMASLRDALGNV